jgi:hypothetical protein
MSQFIIGIIIVVLGVILTTVGGYLAKDGWEKMYHKDKNKRSVDIKQDATGNDNIQAATTGDNSPIIIDGDYVEGDKIVKQGLSESDKEEIVTRIAERLEPQLAKQYSTAHTVFGVYQDRDIVPMGLMPENLEIDWDTGKVQSTKNNVLMVTLPNMTLNGKLFVGGNVTRVEKRIGAKSRSIIKVGWFNPILEVIGIDGELVVVALGFPADDSKK